MRNAPSVSYPVGRSFLRTLLHGLVLASVWLVCGAWGLFARSDDLGRWTVGLACLLATAGLLWAGLRPARGRVRWDGQHWFWSDARPAAAEDLRGRVSVRLDWQRGMLLEFRPVAGVEPNPSDEPSAHRQSVWPGSARWFWVEQDQAPMYWNALRRAAWADATDPSGLSA